MQQDPRIHAMFARDRAGAGVAVLMVWLVYGFTFWTMSEVFAREGIWFVMALLGLIVVLLNAAAVIAMIRHYGDDRSAIYGTDIYYLDRARAARRSKR